MFGYSPLSKAAPALSGGVKNLVVSSGELISDFSNLSLWSVDSGTKAAATAKRFGSGLKLTGNSGATAAISFTPPSQVKTATNISFWVYIYDYTTINNIMLQMETTDWKYKTRSISEYVICTGWNHFKFTIDDPGWNTGSGFSMANLGDIYFAVGAKPSKVPVIDFAELRINEITKPKVIFHFSDGYKSIHSVALPKLKSVGFKGSLGIESSPVLAYNTSFLTLSQLDDLYSAGWCLFNGTHTHGDFSALTEQQMDDEIGTCKKFLLENGYYRGADMFEFPYTPQNITAARPSLLKAGIRAAISHGAYTISAPVADFYQLTAVPVHGGNWASAKAFIDMGIYNGDTIIVNFHDLVGVDATDFNTAVDYIAGLFSKADVVTFDEWYYGK